MDNSFFTTLKVLVVFLLTTIVGVGWTSLNLNGKTALDFSAEAILSDEDSQVFKAPKAANKKAYEQLGRSAWERSQEVQRRAGWNPDGRK